MKKILLVLTMGGLFFSLSACKPRDNSIEDNSIALNMDNYETYINTSARLFGDDVYITTSYDRWYPKVKGEVEVSPAITNFNYIDVVLRVRILGEFTIVGKDSEPPKIYDETITVSLNIGGSGRGSKVITIKHLYNSNYAKNITGLGYEVISVSGKVEPV